MDNITDEEKKMVEELKKRTLNDLTPKMLEDEALFYRFAKARDFNLEQAEAMLRKHISWRKEMKIDTILTEYNPSEILEKYIPLSFACFDKEGCAVIVHDLGRADAKGFTNSASNMEILKFVVYYVEKTKEMVIKKGGNGTKRFQLGKPIFTPIYDFDELTYSKAASMKNLQLIILIIRTFLENYPEFLRTITVINAPIYFTWMYSSMKHLLPATVVQKVGIYSSDGWKEELLEHIEADVLPVYLGGNKTDPDGNPLCETFVIRGQLIPKKYYRKRDKREVALKPGFEKLTLLPFFKKEITFEVKERNSFIEWEFEIINRDIEFSLLFKGRNPEDSELVVLIPKQKIDTTFESEKGFMKCENLGQYTLVFDNSNSWIYPREIYYKAEIKSPQMEEFVKNI